MHNDLRVASLNLLCSHAEDSFVGFKNISNPTGLVLKHWKGLRYYQVANLYPTNENEKDRGKERLYHPLLLGQNSENFHYLYTAF